MSDEIPESVELLAEHIRREAVDLPEYELDVRLAEITARRNVAAAYGRSEAAEAWNDLAIALDDIRRARKRVAREVEKLTGPPPPIIRALTAEELAEIRFDVDDEEPPC